MSCKEVAREENPECKLITLNEFTGYRTPTSREVTAVLGVVPQYELVHLFVCLVVVCTLVYYLTVQVSMLCFAGLLLALIIFVVIWDGCSRNSRIREGDYSVVDCRVYFTRELHNACVYYVCDPLREEYSRLGIEQRDLHALSNSMLLVRLNKREFWLVPF